MNNKTKIPILFLIIFLFSYCSVGAENYQFQGFSWIGNNSQENEEKGSPVIGQISLAGIANNNKPYGVYLEESDDEGITRQVGGVAWMGIGSSDDFWKDVINQGDYPTFGYIEFGAGIPEENCFFAGDCHEARWNQREGATKGGVEGYLSGWAKINLGANGDQTKYPETWIHFKSPPDPANYSCSGGINHYYVCVDNLGKIHGYAWSSGLESKNIQNNPGLGWIKFSKEFAYIESEKDSAQFKKLTAGSSFDTFQFCSTVLDEEKSLSNVFCKGNENDSKDFFFKPYYTGINVGNKDSADNYAWLCGNGDNTPKNSKQVACNYGKVGIYAPKLKIFDSESMNWINCTSQATIEVTDKKVCSVLINKQGLGEEFTNKLTFRRGYDDYLVGKLVRKCLDSGSLAWNVSGGEFVSKDKDSFQIRPFPNSTQMIISATITKDGERIDCSEAQVGVRDVMEWQ